MNITNNNQTSFRAKLTISELGDKCKNRIGSAKNLFEELTKDKSGRLSLVEDIKNGQYLFRLGQGHVYELIQRPQTAFPSKEWFKDFLSQKNETEKADILVKIFDTLQIIPKKIDSHWTEKDFTPNMLNKIQASLGDDKYNISHMFEYIGKLRINREDLY